MRLCFIRSRLYNVLLKSRKNMILYFLVLSFALISTPILIYAESNPSLPNNGTIGAIPSTSQPNLSSRNASPSTNDTPTNINPNNSPVNTTSLNPEPRTSPSNTSEQIIPNSSSQTTDNTINQQESQSTPPYPNTNSTETSQSDEREVSSSELDDNNINDPEQEDIPTSIGRENNDLVNGQTPNDGTTGANNSLSGNRFGRGPLGGIGGGIIRNLISNRIGGLGGGFLGGLGSGIGGGGIPGGIGGGMPGGIGGGMPGGIGGGMPAGIGGGMPGGAGGGGMPGGAAGGMPGGTGGGMPGGTGGGGNTGGPPDATGTYTPENHTQWEEEMLEIVNNHRAQNGLHPLRLDDAVTNSAEQKAQELSDTGAVVGVGTSHHSPTHGPFPNQMINAGISRPAGENIARNSPNASPRQVFESFRRSPGHNRQMLNPNATYIGIGASGGYYAMQFAR